MKFNPTSVLIQCVILVLLFNAASAFAGEQRKHVVMVLSSHGEQQGEQAPGYEFDEFSKAYLVFKANNVDVSIASPKGGQVEADKYDPNKPYNAAVINDQNAMAKLNDTQTIAALEPSKFDGVFVVGGKGAMFDLPYDKALQNLLAKVYEQQGSVAAVCHGPAALVDVTLSDGSFLVAGKTVNGFTNQEEQLFGKKWAPKFDFMLQDKLVERGATFTSSPIMLSHVAVDERLITGQNPSSTIAVAEALVRSMGITPAKMETFRDDRTLALVAELLDGDQSAAKTLADNTGDYHIELVAMYGYYYFNVAETDVALTHALTLMQIGQQAISNPVLDMQIAQAQHKLGDASAAKATLQNILAGQPDYQPALELLESMAM